MNPITGLNNLSASVGERFQDLFLLVARLYVASVFLKSGVQKLSNFSSTKMLFEYEYNVPFLSPNIAAILGTGAEIVLPLLLIVGLLTRFSALALFVFNIVAVASYPALTKGETTITTVFGFIPTGISFPTKGFEDHVVWGILIFGIIAFGAGRFALDYFFHNKYR